ncbi:tetratricopeptide (TPR) repeat protein [Saccharothrix tamanrassetensis]|uniref:Tetratricopeptide (TPR) repeat protein n=1 Tax=Saccharothrix tamanrassetensis TaxID=1051531 RepID=A0A841CMX3_9PSEU|nr:tetratricopeptide repeat protein [Saccharothrix tamanrassetensis]MBB5958470.1 tetratricopeptide (TPR) repeat protein [Saccharothrix tamanrassetensis]
MRDFGRTDADDNDAVERNLDLAWELFAAQPAHPKVAELALQVLAVQPERSSVSLLLANHREICGQADEARRLYLQVAGRRDHQFVNAARALRHLAFAEHDHPEALRWARTALGEDQEEWGDWMELGFAQALCGEHEDGWRQLDEAVALCSRTTPDELPVALGKRAAYLLGTFAPPDRFVPTAEEAVRADAANSWVALMLGWSYLVQYRFADAERLGLRLLREDPTEDLLQGLVGTARTMLRIVENAHAQDITLEDIRRTGVIEVGWRQLRDQVLGIDLASALAALDDVMPAGLRATLRPGASISDVPESDELGSVAAEELMAWHDGQQPGSGAAWGLAEPFRLMSAAEIIAMSAEIEADPAAHPDWPENEVWEQVMTDDAGAYLVVVALGALVKRRPGHPDEPVAESMADWIWDRVADFGGRDLRPAPRQTETLPTDLPAVPGTSLAGVITTMYAALGASERSAPYAELRRLFPDATVRHSALDPVDSSPDGVDIALLDGLVKKITVDVALCPSAGRVISGLDLDGQHGTVDAYVQAHGALVHNSWENRATGEVTVNYDLAEHRLGLEWETGKLARIFVSAAGRPMAG